MKNIRSVNSFNCSRWRPLSALCVLATVGALTAVSQTALADYRDSLLQPPTLERPARGSVAGSVGELSFGPAELARGTQSVATPITAPTERGPVLADVLPSYSPEGGVSEWGIGWSNRLTIRRYRDLGDIDYQADDFLSPWGKLERGSDDFYYVQGFQARVRLSLDAAGWVAIAEDGTRYVFRAQDGTATTQGIYVWSLSSVESLVGERTELEYEANESGRRFLKEVRYAHRTGQFQQRMRLDYETLGAPVTDYRSGAALTLDRRVARVTLESYDRSQATFAERWRHELTYRESQSGVAFYLESVQKIFASGAAEPPYRYSYALSEDVMGAAELRPLPSLDGYLADTHGEGIQPDVVAFFDYERDGALEMEHPADFRRVSQSDQGWVYTALPTVAGSHRFCRPAPSPANRPRRLLRMRPGEAKPNVLVAKPQTNETGIMVCDYEGRPLYSKLVPGVWEPGPNTHVVDLDRDLAPDFIRIDRGQYRILKNTSSADAFSFSPGPTGVLEPAFDPVSSGARDFNGDGNVDLFSRSEHGLTIWWGLGQMQFERQGTFLEFRTRSGQTLADITPFDLTIGDFNADGLADIIFSNGALLYLFTNHGDHFRELPVPGFDALDQAVGYPVAVDLEGHGEEQAVMVSAGGALAVTLSKPESGLLVAVDDGKGGRVTFDYQRARPNPGLGQRPAMLAGMTVSATGEQTIRYEYDYLEPVFHSKSEYLLGFGKVRRSSPLSLEDVEFQNSDEVQGLVLQSSTADAHQGNVFRVQENGYARVQLLGLPWEQPTTSATRWLSGSEIAAGSRVEHLSYDGLCELETRSESAHGVLEASKAFVSPPALQGGLSCLPASETLRGIHPAQSDADFHYDSQFSYNDLGQILQVTAGGQVLQAVDYDALHRARAVRIPGHGETRYMYAEPTGQLSEIRSPDGTVMRAEQIDPLTGALLELSQDRGASERFREYFAFDGQERLERSWDNLGPSSSSSPGLQIEYAFADGTHPASIVEHTAVDAALGVRRDAVEFQSATGRKLGSAGLAEQGWVFGGLSQVYRAEGRSTNLQRAPLPAGLEPARVDLETLFEPGQTSILASGVQSPLGYAVQSQSLVQTGVSRTETTAVSVSNGEVAFLTEENGLRPTLRTTDGDGRTLSSTDASGATTQFGYDALGRLVSVTLPNGEQQSVRFDAQGRPLAVAHDSLGQVSYAYDADTGLLRERRYEAADGSLIRRQETSYDSIGRPILERHQAGADRLEYALSYDGAETGESIPGEEGQLTQVSGPRYQRRIRHNLDGKVRSLEIELTGWRAVRLESKYFADGSVASTAREIRDAGGTLLDRSERRNVLNAHGQLIQVVLNGEVLYGLSYDAEGRVAAVALPNGERVVPNYDPSTHALRGYSQSSSDWELSVDRVHDQRGLTSREQTRYSYADGTSEVHDRSYGYDDRRFLERMSSADGDAQYGYDANGNLDSVSDARGQRSFTRIGDTLLAGPVRYRYDVAGRVIERADLQLDYGPNGQIARASHAGRSFEFIYDEGDQRVMKLEGGVPVVAYLQGSLLSEHGWIEAVNVNDRVIGVIDNGVFRSIATDPRGSVLANEAGDFSAPSPYGARETHSELAEALDYVAKGFDADLGLVRMGVRDYDPELGQFTTPDPLFRERIEKCAASPVECNLYSYAGNDPIGFVDPAGTDAEVQELTKVIAFDAPGRSYDSAAGQLIDALTRKEATGSYTTEQLPQLTWHGWDVVDVSTPIVAGIDIQKIGGLLAINTLTQQWKGGAKVISALDTSNNGLLTISTHLENIVSLKAPQAVDATTSYGANTEALSGLMKVFGLSGELSSGGVKIGGKQESSEQFQQRMGSSIVQTVQGPMLRDYVRANWVIKANGWQDGIYFSRQVNLGSVVVERYRPVMP